MTTTSEILDALQFSFLRNREIMASATGAEGSWSDLRGTNGDDKIIYFKFADNGLPDDFAMTGALSGWEVLSIADKGAIRAVLEEIETYLDIDFVETTGTPDLDIGMVDLQATGAPANVVVRGGVAITYGSEGVVGYKGGVAFDNNFDVADPDNVGTIFHEIAHGLGLKHPFEGPSLPAAEENNKYTVMSYTPNPETGRDATNLMLYDVVALQDIWGAATHNDTDTVYDLSSHDELKVIWDTGGIDRLDMQGQSGPVTVNLTEGVFSSLAGVHDLVIGFGTQIEEARGSVGRDRLTGNAADNWLDGGASGDTLMGGDGADTLLGRGGRDRLWGENGDDVLTGGGGADMFMFVKGSGIDRIRDFTSGEDQIILAGFTGDPLSLATGTAQGLRIDFGDGDVLILNAVTPADLSQSDFGL